MHSSAFTSTARSTSLEATATSASADLTFTRRDHPWITSK
ncbi:hypothetical protein KIY85_gp91 [Mycobacterium phage Heffalump]|uniref:Uncharacterized protein n=1 Tax=Mycobacterium phage Heffalump TaxID=1983575 RepID=A0A220NSL1_9CAUD|nr:hypothetical protein KIY85_gp91 [Mycobacterium phage Heffalump]ASJ79793.1 hypothetical protein SEA_HEFFALUMP_91 [Mycobacterium phage Heffalump]